MDWMNWGLAVLLVMTSLATAVLALWLTSRIGTSRRPLWQRAANAEDTVAFLFEDDALIDCSPAGRKLLSGRSCAKKDWDRLMALLEPKFANLRQKLGQLAEVGDLTLTSQDSGMTLCAHWHDGIARIELKDPTEGHQAAPNQNGSFGSLAAALDMQDLALLRDTSNNAPCLIWAEDADGKIQWVNDTYAALCTQLSPEGEAPGWPPPRIFDEVEVASDPSEDSEAEAAPKRLSVQTDGGSGSMWFDVTSRKTGANQIFYAVPADRLHKAETGLREFVQTLTKTFAHLPTGLVVFDRQRRLALFNPAIIDLTDLEPQFLSARPVLHDFLDALREKRRMPEPKDYKDWRRQIAELESAAATGTHVETWSLPSGQTYRVTGRPHPDGAVAFLFEDITSEVSLTRRFRSELELGQSVVDQLPHALCVVSATGDLIMSNAAYDAHWGTDASVDLGTHTIDSALATWTSQTEPNPIWNDIRAFCEGEGERKPRTGNFQMRDGRAMTARITPLANHAAMICFQDLNMAEPTPNDTAAPRVGRRRLSLADAMTPDVAAQTDRTARAPIIEETSVSSLASFIKKQPANPYDAEDTALDKTRQLLAEANLESGPDDALWRTRATPKQARRTRRKQAL